MMAADAVATVDWSMPRRLVQMVGDELLFLAANLPQASRVVLGGVVVVVVDDWCRKAKAPPVDDNLVDKASAKLSKQSKDSTHNRTSVAWRKFFMVAKQGGSNHWNVAQGVANGDVFCSLLFQYILVCDDNHEGGRCGVRQRRRRPSDTSLLGFSEEPCVNVVQNVRYEYGMVRYGTARYGTVRTGNKCAREERV